MFNEALVEEGHTRAYPHEPNKEHEGRFAEAQEVAKDREHAGSTGSKPCCS